MADFSFDQNISGSLLSDVTADAELTLGGLDDINVDTTVGGRLDSAITTTSEVRSTSDSNLSSSLQVAPLMTSSTIDLEPVAVDTCVRVELGGFPPTQIRTPWEQRLGLNVLGVELFSWVLCGESTTSLLPVRPPPLVAGTVEQSRSAVTDASHGDGAHDQAPEHRAGHGIEIRLA